MEADQTMYRIILNLSIAFIVVATAVSPIAAQSFGQIADKTIGYVKAGTFGKPKVAKNTSKLAIGQVRVHYKFVTSRASQAGSTAADVTVYLDTDLTNGDLQKLTDEFYLMLAAKLNAAGIATPNFEELKSTEYYLDRQKTQEDKKPQDVDGKSGQAWVSFSAFDGPVFMRWKPYGTPEMVGFGKLKGLAGTSKAVGGDLATFDVVLDFASITLNSEIKQDRQGWFYGDPYFHADYSIGGGMSVPQSYIFMVDQKNGFDQYQSLLPVADAKAFAGKPYKDETKAALATSRFWSTERKSFTPLVIPANRERYLLAARSVLSLYADLFVEKMKVVRGENKSDGDNKADVKPRDTTTLKQVEDTARKNNDTTAVTTGEVRAAAEQAERDGKFQLAADYYGRLIELRPDDAEPYLKQSALFLNKLNQPKLAIKVLDDAIKRFPKEGALYYNRGTAFTKTEEWKKAKKDFDAALATNPNYVEALLNRAIANYYLKDFDAALADANRGIEVNPRYANLYRIRAYIYKAKGNAALAQADEIRAAQLER